MSFDELTKNKSTNKILEDVLHGCDDGELYFEDTINESFLFDDNVLKSSSFNKIKGFGLRAINNELIGYSHSNNINTTSLKNAAEIVSAVKKGNRSGKPSCIRIIQDKIKPTTPVNTAVRVY